MWEIRSLRKIFDVSAPDPWQIWSGSCKDSLFFPEEKTKSWKKCVATEFQDPVRISIIQNGKKKISDHIFQDFTRFPRRCYQISCQDLCRIGLGFFQDVISFLTGSLQDFLNRTEEKWTHRVSISRPSVYIPISLPSWMCHVILYHFNVQYLNFWL